MTKKINKPRKCPLAYSSESKNWWQQNSERIGGELNWDVFNEIWMAGYDDGHEEGYTAGHSDGRDSGFDAGYDQGRELGREEGSK